MPKPKKMNLNEVARSITLKEGGKQSLSISQVKEVLCLALEIFGDYPAYEVLRVIYERSHK